MKEASGELNMTLVTIVAIAAVGALFAGFIWPRIQDRLTNEVDNESNMHINVAE